MDENKDKSFRWMIGTSVWIHILLLPLSILIVFVPAIKIITRGIKNKYDRDFYVNFTENCLYYGILMKDSHADFSNAEFCSPTLLNRVGLKNIFPKVIAIPYQEITDVKISNNGWDIIAKTQASKAYIRVDSADKDLIYKIHEEMKTRFGYRLS